MQQANQTNQSIQHSKVASQRVINQRDKSNEKQILL
jgi:hypothetical protein